MRVIGYIRLSKGDKDSHSLDGQHASIARWCKANGHQLVTVIAEVGSAKTPHKLKGRRLAISAVLGGMAEGVAVRDLDRVTRSMFDSAHLLENAKRYGWVLYGAVDGLDTSDEEQELSTNVKIIAAQEERRKLARRTREGLAIAKARRVAEGKPALGKPRQVKPELERRIVRLANRGHTAYAIAARFDREGIPTPQGGKAWAPSVIRDVIARNAKAVAA